MASASGEDRRPPGREAMRRGYARSEQRNAELRAGLTPLEPGERPAALKVAVAAAIGLALANVVLFATGAEVPGRGSSAAGLLFVAVMLLAAWGMWNRRYWAVLGFEVLLGLIAVFFSAFLLVASNIAAVVICVAVVASSGWLFWKLVRVMGRIQASQRVS